MRFVFERAVEHVSLFDPSEDDKKYDKKPRFRQDMIVYAVIFLGGLIAILYALYWAK